MWYRIAIILLVTLISSSVHASIGEVTDLRGTNSSLKRGSDNLTPTKGTGLEMQDAISTRDASLQLEFIDKTRVDVTEHSRMVIDEFIYDPNSGTGALNMKATLGAVRYASGQIAKNSRQRVNIRTPSAKITVRGTDFMMLVDEIGGSMITLLPSCDTTGACVVGEIAVESDVGVVIMNQAFQTTVVPHRGAHPGPTVILDIPENLLRSLLIVRKKSPYNEQLERQYPVTNLLDIDFLAYDELDRDPLVEGIKNIWVTDLDNMTHLDEVWVDEMQRMMDEIMAQWIDELDAQNADFFREKFLGLDPETNIFYDEFDGHYFIRRKEGDQHILQLRLAFYYGYSINFEQNGFSQYGYRIGIGSNSTIDIRQTD